jgi:hypothetical protein
METKKPEASSIEKNPSPNRETEDWKEWTPTLDTIPDFVCVGCDFREAGSRGIIPTHLVCPTCGLLYTCDGKAFHRVDMK